MKLLAVFLLVSSVVIQASAHYCPNGWTPIYNRCFRYVPYQKSWVNAEKNCLSMGANLASVHSMNEYSQVRYLISVAGHGSRLAWIGGSDIIQWRTWLWSNGRRMNYTNWCPGQPDNLFSTQHCLIINYSSKKCWDDMGCNDRYPSVCVKRP